MPPIQKNPGDEVVATFVFANTTGDHHNAVFKVLGATGLPGSTWEAFDGDDNSLDSGAGIPAFVRQVAPGDVTKIVCTVTLPDPSPSDTSFDARVVIADVVVASSILEVDVIQGGSWTISSSAA